MPHLTHFEKVVVVPPMEDSILICHDDPSFRFAMTRAMARLGLNVRTAASAQQALDIAEKTALRYAVIDLHMRRTNGFRLLSELRALQRDMRVMVLTGTDVSCVYDVVKRLGAHACRAKPVGAEEVLALLKTPAREALSERFA